VPVPSGVRDLPVLETLASLGDALSERRGAVLVAPPGAGKTTVVPLWLLDQPWLAGQRIVMLEPRRLATRAAAQRMASLLGEEVGRTVGYQTRDERRIGRDTRVEVVTEGVLTRRLQNDQSLSGVGIVIFDEVHERNLPTDIGLALALDVRAQIRPDLWLLAMSATPDTPKLAALLGDDAGPAPVVESAGREHPVDIRSLPIPGGASKSWRIEQPVADAVSRALREEQGDVLVFLPGIAEIRRVEALLRASLPADVDIRPLAGALALADQDEALRPSPPGRRRVVLSTDIAESSLTVAGIRIVVDAGLARVPRFDPRTGMTRLVTVATSRASADQRAGRAGRTEPGVCYRLWSKMEHNTRLAHLPAEITQVDLAGLGLELAAWGSTAESLQFLDPPPAKALRAADELLTMLHAVDGGRITPLGRSLLALPVHPRLARMVAGADECDRPLACVVAAIVDERDILRGRPDELPADLGYRVRIVCGDERDDRADRRGVERVRDRALDIAKRARVSLRFSEVDAGRTGAVLALAYPDRVGVTRARGSKSQAGQFQLRTGGGAWVAKEDAIATERFIVAADLDGSRTNSRIRLGAGLDAAELERSLAEEVERQVTLSWDKQRDDLVQREETRLGSMLLDERTRSPEPGAATVAALVERVRITRLGGLDLDSAVGLRARLAFLRSLLADEPEQLGEWPDWSDAALLTSLDDWLAPYLSHATGRADLERLDVSLLLTSALSWDQQTQLAELAPPTLTTPKGRPSPIDYTRDPPTVSVRVQHVFGMKRHPAVAGGRVPLAVELLSPADRPIQITRDLPGFWSGSWSQVRKEMVGRYPKHSWPI